MSFGKENSSSKATSNSSSNQTATPNNLTSLQHGWNVADAFLNGTGAKALPLASQGLDLTQTGANATSAAATGGLNTALNFANGGAANPANTYLTPFANGSMSTDSNPYFQRVVDQISRALQPQVDGGFAAAGRYGSGANAHAFHSALDNEVGQLGFNDYNSALDRQVNAGGQLSANNSNSTNAALAALGLVPNLGSAATGAGTALYGAGAAPTNTFATILSLLGPGGGTTNGTANGTQTGSQSSMGFSANLLSPTGGGDAKSLFQMLGI